MSLLDTLRMCACLGMPADKLILLTWWWHLSALCYTHWLCIPAFSCRLTTQVWTCPKSLPGAPKSCYNPPSKWSRMLLRCVWGGCALVCVHVRVCSSALLFSCMCAFVKVGMVKPRSLPVTTTRVNVAPFVNASSIHFPSIILANVMFMELMYRLCNLSLLANRASEEPGSRKCTRGWSRAQYVNPKYEPKECQLGQTSLLAYGQALRSRFVLSLDAFS